MKTWYKLIVFGFMLAIFFYGIQYLPDVITNNPVFYIITLLVFVAILGVLAIKNII